MNAPFFSPRARAAAASALVYRFLLLPRGPRRPCSSLERVYARARPFSRVAPVFCGRLLIFPYCSSGGCNFVSRGDRGTGVGGWREAGLLDDSNLCIF